MPWIFSQSTGQISNGTQTWLGYSGAYNFGNPAYQSVKDKGPIPRGTYTIMAPTTEKGPLTLPLEPDSRNEMFQRSGLLCHGDNSQRPGHGSSGCIVAPFEARQAMATAAASGDATLQVTS